MDELLNKLANDFYNYTTNISIGEDELFDRYTEDFPWLKYATYTEIVSFIKNHYKYTFENSIDDIKSQLENDIDCYNYGIEHKYIKEIYEKIKAVYKDFYIEKLELEFLKDKIRNVCKTFETMSPKQAEMLESLYSPMELNSTGNLDDAYDALVDLENRIAKRIEEI